MGTAALTSLATVSMSAKPAWRRLLTLFLLGIAVVMAHPGAHAQTRRDDAYRPQSETSVLTPPPGYENPPQQSGYGQNTYGQPQTYGQPTYGSQPPYGRSANSSQQNGSYQPYTPGQDDTYRPPANNGYSAPPDPSYGAPYTPPGRADSGPPPPPPGDGPANHGYYEQNEIVTAGGSFFGAISKGLASAIEYTYANVGRPNGYILGEDGSGAYFAGLRYGEGKLFTKDAGDYKVFWQGPSIGLDVGGEGSKIMILCYNMRDPSDIYNRFGGVEGSTYVVGGVSVQLQSYGPVTLALIRSGLGLRLGVNVGYLKYTREPTWNPF